MKLYVVRHGQTIFNQLNKVQGWADTPLTKKGEKDGKMAGQRLKNVKFNAAYSSDTSRAIHTAEFVLAENNNRTPQLKFMPEWREYFFGSFEGGSNDIMWGAVADAFDVSEKTPDAIAESIHDMTAIMNKIHEVDPQHIGETAADFWERMSGALDHLKAKHQPNDNILIVTHGQLIGNLAQHYAHLNDAQRPHNGAVAVFDLDESGLKVTHFNDLETNFI